MLDQSLLNAYHQTNYCLADTIINIGIPSAKVSSLLKPHMPNGGIFISAWNPLGKVATDNMNKQANQILQQNLLEQGLIVLEGYGESPDGEWREDSYFAYPISEQSSLELCNRYKQNAVMYVQADGLPKLILNSIY